MKRCFWCNLENPKYVEYHDNEWGILNTSDKYLFEMLILESFQAGLSWECILNKREAFKKAYDDFDIDKVINYKEDKINELLNNKNIIRNKLKINASINNAKIFKDIAKEYQSFYNYLSTFTKDKIIYESNKTTSPLSDKISKDLYKRGMRFVGSTIIYSYLQAVGIINSHEKYCFMHKSSKPNIEVGKNAGFCSGVELCTKKLEKLLDEYKKIYCIGDVVHNKDVVNYFKQKGLIVTSSLKTVPDNENMIIRAHGTTKELYKQMKDKNLKIFDLTCPKVLNIRSITKEYLNKDTYIILVANKNHPETLGTISYCGNSSTIIENEEEINEIINTCSNFKNILIIGQTTFSIEKFNKYIKIIKNKLKGKNIIIKNTICNATKIRQEEVLEMSKRKECMIIIGGKNSSNTKKLYDIASSNCKNTYLIENKDDLDINKFKKFNNIGIMAGASTPKKSIDEVIKEVVN